MYEIVSCQECQFFKNIFLKSRIQVLCAVIIYPGFGIQFFAKYSIPSFQNINLTQSQVLSDKNTNKKCFFKLNKMTAAYQSVFVCGLVVLYSKQTDSPFCYKTSTRHCHWCFITGLMSHGLVGVSPPLFHWAL